MASAVQGIMVPQTSPRRSGQDVRAVAEVTGLRWFWVLGFRLLGFKSRIQVSGLTFESSGLVETCRDVRLMIYILHYP